MEVRLSGARGLHRDLVVLLGFAAPLAVAAAWTPVRSRLPNADLALILIGSVTAIGAFGRRTAVVVGSISAALWFEFFDTAPFERLAIARSPDVETTLVLVVVALVSGEFALRAARYRWRRQDDLESLRSVGSSAALVASGEELVRVIDQVSSDLVNLLGLVSCTFEADRDDPVAGEDAVRFELTRDGTLLDPLGLAHDPSDRAPLVAELPVIVQGETLGWYVLRFGRSELPESDRRRVAVTLSDHVGAAFLAQAPPMTPTPDEPRRSLRLVRADSGHPVHGPLEAGRQETAGFASEAGRMIS